MRTILVSATLVLAPVAATANDLIVEACERAAIHFHNVERVFRGATQSFPDLKPARVNMRYSTSEGGPASLSAALAGKKTAQWYPEAARCEFNSASKPLQITAFCSKDCVAKSRLEEIQALLTKDGF
jgi:hypothetical protein